RLPAGTSREARRARGRPRRCGAAAGRVVPLESPVLLRSEQPRDAGDAPRGVRAIPAPHSRQVSRREVCLPWQHRSRVPAESVRSDRRRRCIRGWVHGPRGPHRRSDVPQPAAGDGLRIGDGIAGGRSVRCPAPRADHAPGGPRSRKGVPRSRAFLPGRRGMTKTDRYAAAGVRLDTADEAKRRIAQLVSATRTPLARGRVGGFGGMVRVPEGYKKPVLVMSTDGVGSKVLVAAAAGVHDTVGEDLVNHSVNDILVHGATPLAFLDYIATGTLVPEVAAQIVTGVARGCRAHEMTLAGGETAQLPDLYAPGQYDLAGSIVGVVEEDQAIHG